MMRALMLLAAMAGAAWGAAPPAALTAGQEKVLVERNRLLVAGLKAWVGGKQEDAIALVGKTLQVQSRLMGPWHRDTELLADLLGRWHGERGEWTAEAESRRAVIVARGRLHGEGHWRTADARRGLAEALAQQERTPAQWKAIREAAGLNAIPFNEAKTTPLR